MDMAHMHSSSTMDMATSSATAATASTAMSDMSTMSGMGSMSMVFTTAHNTPLYSSAWTPTSTGAYAGTCIFLILLAVIARLLQASRHVLEQRWHDQAIKRRYVVVADPLVEGEPFSDEPKDSNKDKTDQDAVLTSRGMDEKVRVITTKSRSKEATPWRLSTDIPRACVYTAQAGVGYLL